MKTFVLYLMFTFEGGMTSPPLPTPYVFPTVQACGAFTHAMENLFLGLSSAYGASIQRRVVDTSYKCQEVSNIEARL